MKRLLLLLTMWPTAGAAQSLLERSPNVSGDWVANPGTLQFNFTHRFLRSPAPERKVSNFPTFMIGVGLPRRTMLGFGYSTNSTLAARYPNEWEFFLRHALLSEFEGAPLDLGGQVGYNLASDGVDGEISLAKRVSRFRIVGVTRVLANPYTAGRTQLVVGGGTTVRLGSFVALGGDVAAITNQEPGHRERTAWSAGLHLAIPNTPHTLSFQATNTNTSTLQGASRGEDRIRYGFEFTIPLTLARYFRRTNPSPTVSESPAARGAVARPDSAGPTVPVVTMPDSGERPAIPPSTREDSQVAKVTPDSLVTAPARPASTPAAAVAKPAAPKVSRAGMRGLAFLPRRVEISVGTTLVWRNEDPLAHTVTAVDGSFDSGLIGAGSTWRKTFSKPGTYQVTCTPHPFMKATIVVKAVP